jgi:hypothetical protein
MPISPGYLLTIIATIRGVETAVEGTFLETIVTLNIKQKK